MVTGKTACQGCKFASRWGADKQEAKLQDNPEHVPTHPAPKSQLSRTRLGLKG